ncbi:hypothetical protein HELRODRAFT_185198 [Helobdella robusta]|uniref:Zinc finger HIT domain-containing protein 3 n=1 Tax=Helobdella robusta TaxID=6412 RepID=T1FMH9_HELRO|nr:hypothetical protein HELRODRAFT_185198 [Helobdella robusta]ESN91730.1 hypothetical protein HELRODRAFT_185198 [Helobdella robusta]
MFNESSPMCGVCSEILSKYKCPKCYLRYCSLSCYKQHRDSCALGKVKSNDGGSKPTESLQQHTLPLTSSCASAKRETNGLLNTVEIETDSEDDKVDEEKLEKLWKSKELQLMLSNNHLKDLIKHLNESTEPGDEIQKLMGIPIFREFAELCLKNVDKRNLSQLNPSIVEIESDQL